MKLVLERRDHRHQLVAMLEQLAQVALLRRRNPEAREALRAQQFEQVLGIPAIGLLPSQGAGPDLGCVAHPQLIIQLRHQPLEPLCIAGRLYPHLRRSRQTGVESPGFTIFVLQPAGHQLTRLAVQHRNNLVARMQITSDNQHGSAPLLGQPWFRDNPSLPLRRSRRRYLISVLTGVLRR